MKRIKKFEAFTLPGRNIVELVKSCLQDMLDEQGDHVSIKISPEKTYIYVKITIDQQLKKSEIEAFCDEYVFPGIGRIGDEGFDIIKQKEPGAFLSFMGAGKEPNEHYYNGVKSEIDGRKTEICFELKNELK